MSADLDRLTRWEHSGGSWRVTSRRAGFVAVALETCSGGEVMGVIETQADDVLGYVGDSAGSEERL